MDGDVFLFGQLRPMSKGLALAPAEEGGLMIAGRDPRAWVTRRMLLAGIFIVVEILLAAGARASRGGRRASSSS